MEASPCLDRDGNPSGVWKYEGHVANRGLELIGKKLGMFSETEKELTQDHYNSVHFYLPSNSRGSQSS